MYLIDSSHNSKCIHNNLNSHSPACTPPSSKETTGSVSVYWRNSSDTHMFSNSYSPAFTQPTPNPTARRLLVEVYWKNSPVHHTHVPVLCCSCTPIHIHLHPSTHFPTPLARRQLGRYQCIGRTVLTVVVWGLFWHSAYYLAPLLSSFSNHQLDLKTKNIQN